MEKNKTEGRIRNQIKNTLFFSFLVVVLIHGVFMHTLLAELVVDVKDGDEWSYMKGDTILSGNWTHADYNDSQWLIGKSSFGYGIEGCNTVLNDMKGNYATIYIRHTFTLLSHPNELTKMIVSVDCAGPFHVYMNGIEVIRSPNRMTEDLDISGFSHELILGTNVLAIQCFNEVVDRESFVLRPTFQIFQEESIIE